MCEQKGEATTKIDRLINSIDRLTAAIEAAGAKAPVVVDAPPRRRVDVIIREAMDEAVRSVRPHPCVGHDGERVLRGS